MKNYQQIKAETKCLVCDSCTKLTEGVKCKSISRYYTLFPMLSTMEQLAQQIELTQREIATIKEEAARKVAPHEEQLRKLFIAQEVLLGFVLAEADPRGAAPDESLLAHGRNRENEAEYVRSRPSEVINPAMTFLRGRGDEFVPTAEITDALVAQGVKLGVTVEEQRRRVTSILSAYKRDFEGQRGAGYRLTRRGPASLGQQFLSAVGGGSLNEIPLGGGPLGGRHL